MSNVQKRQHATNHRSYKMPKLFIAGLLGCAMVIGAGNTWAGESGHGYKHDPQSRLEKMSKKFDLTKEQQDKILPILQEKHQKMEALHNQMKEARRQAMSQIEAQLNPEQKEKFQKSREERREKMKEYKEKHKGGKGHGKGKKSKGEDHD